MKKYFLLSVIFCFLFFEFSVFAGDAKITGRVNMPVIEKQKRSFRGRLYRNRLASRRAKPESEKKVQNPFEDIIIAAYPLKGVPPFKPTEKARIIQKNAEFIPHVLPVTRGTTVEFINVDRFFHNVFSITPGARFNIGRRPTNTIIRRRIETGGEIKLFCDIHSQMNAIILSLDTPYFTRVNKNGIYSLEGLPPGAYRIEVYHPEFGSIKEVVSLSEDEQLQKTFTLTN